MALHPVHRDGLERLARYYKPAMLMLGATASALPGYSTARAYFARWVGDAYEDLDLDGGDLRLDLNRDLGLNETHETVFNLGTIEHVWNAHNAWANALRAVRTGGHLLCHMPVAGFVDHGLHITSAAAVRAFVGKNGFEIVESWTAKRSIGQLLWLAARKHRHIARIEDFEPAWQIYEAGRKKNVV